MDEGRKMMKKLILKGTDLELSNVCLGTANFGEKLTKEQAYEVLVNGADISTMDIAYVDASTLVKKAVPERAEKLGITIPDDFVAIGSEADDAEKEAEELPKYLQSVSVSLFSIRLSMQQLKDLLIHLQRCLVRTM